MIRTGLLPVRVDLIPKGRCPDAIWLAASIQVSLGRIKVARHLDDSVSIRKRGSQRGVWEIARAAQQDQERRGCGTQGAKLIDADRFA
jgi:hypothetical protein